MMLILGFNIRPNLLIEFKEGTIATVKLAISFDVEVCQDHYIPESWDLTES